MTSNGKDSFGKLYSREYITLNFIIARLEVQQLVFCTVPLFSKFSCKISSSRRKEKNHQLASKCVVTLRLFH